MYELLLSIYSAGHDPAILTSSFVLAAVRYSTGPYAATTYSPFIVLFGIGQTKTKGYKESHRAFPEKCGVSEPIWPR